MSRRHVVAILTAILRAQDPSIEGDTAVLQAIAIERAGMPEAQLLAALTLIVLVTRKSFTRSSDPGTEILRDVDYTLALQGALDRQAL